ncbi:hypothetical protein HYFRA_00000838 [Hymenoscyphus fraxineus]|uniref:BTB domain-containing protein n=1 Tax=Hymenoscyphus fraxineus TaxID=746836 RepID=A0A9N9PQH8_9HELO|nr:hypothetical protein HYFRA_00000838 [Hymenoscyphus fraxineus]
MRFVLDNGVDITRVEEIRISEREEATFRKYAEPYSCEGETTLILRHQPVVFGHLFEWMTKKRVRCVEPLDYNRETHISDWCHLHLLAHEFGYDDLARLCSVGYKSRRLSNEEEWEPLPAEIDLLYGMPIERTAALRHVILEHMTMQVLSWNMMGDPNRFAKLVSRNNEFANDIFGGVGRHVVGFSVVAVGEICRLDCDVESCGIHGDWEEYRQIPSLSDFEPDTGILRDTPEFEVDCWLTAEELQAFREAEEEEEAEARAVAEACKAQLEEKSYGGLTPL